MSKLPIYICTLCWKENPDENHKMHCSEKYKPKKFIQSAKWIRVEDKLPPSGIEVLIYCEEGILIGRYWKFIEAKYNLWDAINYGTLHPTHWVPLPEKPE